ncbi:MAG: N-acetyl-gamma-glutamyl-phosphate reductase [Actinomycetes bacterium]
MIPVGIVGGSGYTGAELLRLCASHPEFAVRVATGDSQAGTPVADLYPSLAAAYRELSFVPWDPAQLDEVEVLFVALPHGKSQALMDQVLGNVRVVVDLGADFRLPDPATYEAWYHEPHTRPDLLDQFVYGLPELYREQLRGASAIANPGCYPTAASLALAPLVRAGLVEPVGLVVDAASGVSGAGRPPRPGTTFCAVDEDVSAYGLLDHRHTPEMEMNTGGTVLFTPHLVPMNRGILATCYGRATSAATTSGDALSVLADFYAEEPFVVVSERSPSTKATLGSNSVHLTARVDARTGTVVAIAALDNLCKGASGAAVQNANLALGLDETAGLPLTGTYP